MNILNFIFDWQFVTYITPILGIGLCFFLLISSRICTLRKAVSTSIALFLMLWLLLTWADWGSTVYVPSYQILWVRLIMLAISGLIIYELRFLRRRILRYQAINRQLIRQNKSLIKNLNEITKKADEVIKNDNHI